MATLAVVLGLTGDVSLGGFGPGERAAFLILAILSFGGRMAIKRIHSKAGFAKSLLEEQRKQ